MAVARGTLFRSARGTLRRCERGMLRKECCIETVTGCSQCAGTVAPKYLRVKWRNANGPCGGPATCPSGADWATYHAQGDKTVTHTSGCTWLYNPCAYGNQCVQIIASGGIWTISIHVATPSPCMSKRIAQVSFNQGGSLDCLDSSTWPAGRNAFDPTGHSACAATPSICGYGAEVEYGLTTDSFSW